MRGTPPSAFRFDQPWPGREALREPVRLDRRRAPRWAVEGTATLLGLGEGLGAIARLTELDGAPWWLGGLGEAPVPVGLRVTVGFSAPDGRPADGTVERCERHAGRGWRIAIRFDGAPGHP